MIVAVVVVGGGTFYRISTKIEGADERRDLIIIGNG